MTRRLLTLAVLGCVPAAMGLLALAKFSIEETQLSSTVTKSCGVEQ
jgi:hypothetical protein